MIAKKTGKEYAVSKRQKTIYRVFASILAALIALSLLLHFFGFRSYTNESLSKWEQRFTTILCVCINIISIIFCILCIIFPEKSEYLSLTSFVYMAGILFTDPTNLLAVILFTLGVAALAIRGHLKTKIALKHSLLTALFIIPLAGSIRLGWHIFLNGLLTNTVGILLDIMVFTFVQKYVSSIKGRYDRTYVDMTKYKELTERDMQIIKYLMEGQKYEWIAGNLDISTPTVKKRIKTIFEILDVPDLTGFHAQFGGRNLLYTEEQVLDWKKAYLSKNFSEYEKKHSVE